MISIIKLSREHIYKTFFASIFFLLSFSLINTWNTPALGYESSIYLSTPIIFWIILIFSAIIGIIYGVFSITKAQFYKDKFLKFGILLLFFCYIVSLSLFIFRGYYMWDINGDTASHIGWVKETLITGQFPSFLFYPLMHIYLSNIAIISNLDLVTLHKLVPLIFELLFILFIYILANALFIKRAITLLIVIISCCFPYSWYLIFTPNLLANFIFPLVLFILIKYTQEGKMVWFISLLFFLIFIPIFHFIPTLIFMIILISFFFVSGAFYFHKYYLESRSENFIITKFRRLLFVFFIILLWSIFWFSLFNIFSDQVLSFNKIISGDETNTYADSFLITVSKTEKTGYNVVEQIIKNLWSQIILCLLSLLSLPILIKNRLIEKRIDFILSFGICFLGVIVLTFVFYVFNLGLTPLRFLFYFSFFGTFFSAYFLFYFLKLNLSKRYFFYFQHFILILTVMIIISIFIGNLLALYPSPYLLKFSEQTTRSEIDGMQFIFNNRDIDIELTGIMSAPGRVSHFLLTPDEQKKQQLPRYLEKVIPYHFGYNLAQSIKYIYPNETDIIITQKERKLWVDVLPEIERYRYTRDEFGRLLLDSGLNYLYSNGEFDFFKINY